MIDKDKNILVLQQIGKNIRKERIAKNMTLKELANKLNMSYATVQKYEIGKIEPSIIMLLDISDILNINISRLLNVNIEINVSKSELKEDIQYIKSILEQILTYNKDLNVSKYKKFINRNLIEKLNYLLAPIYCEVIFIDNEMKLKTKNGIYSINDNNIDKIYNEIINFMEFNISKYEF